MKNLVDRLTRFEHDVHMIRHHTPGEEQISVFIEMRDRVRNELCDAWITHETFAGTFVQTLFGPFANDLLDCVQFSWRRLPFHPLQLGDPYSSLSLEFLYKRARHCIEEIERYEVRPVFDIPVR